MRMNKKQNAEQKKMMWDSFNDFHYHCDTERFQKILARAELVRMVKHLPGDVIDAGVFKGTSALEFAHMLEVFGPHSRSKVYGFDTFEAEFPHVHDYEKAQADKHATGFNAEAYDQIIDTIEKFQLHNRLELIKGDIIETLPELLESKPGLRVKLVHCDMDIYEPTVAALHNLWPRIVLGGVVAFDEYAEYGWGESNAADEFLKTLCSPPKLRVLDFASSPTAYLVKEAY